MKGHSRSSALLLLAVSVIGGLYAIRRRRPKRSLSRLRLAIMGNTRDAVAATLGPPRALARDIWYYPLDHRRRTALAIRFHDNIAERVDFIAGPAPQS
jgi:hypothetical protein